MDVWYDEGIGQCQEEKGCGCRGEFHGLSINKYIYVNISLCE